MGKLDSWQRLLALKRASARRAIGIGPPCSPEKGGALGEVPNGERRAVARAVS